MTDEQTERLVDEGFDADATDSARMRLAAAVEQPEVQKELATQVVTERLLQIQHTSHQRLPEQHFIRQVELRIIRRRNRKRAAWCLAAAVLVGALLFWLIMDTRKVLLDINFSTHDIPWQLSIGRLVEGVDDDHSGAKLVAAANDTQQALPTWRAIYIYDNDPSVEWHDSAQVTVDYVGSDSVRSLFLQITLINGDEWLTELTVSNRQARSIVSLSQFSALNSGQVRPAGLIKSLSVYGDFEPTDSSAVVTRITMIKP